MDIEWRPTATPGYEVSSIGTVRNTRTGKVLKPWTHKSGHLYLRLGKLSSGSVQVHRLVLLAFTGQPPSTEHECRHLDGNPTNNNIRNLVWGTRTENVADTVRMDRNIKGDRHPASKLSEADVLAICAAVDFGERVRSVADRYGVTHGHVSSIAQGTTWGWLTHRTPIRAGNRAAKLSPDDVIRIRAASAAGQTRSSLATKFGVSSTNISHIVRRDTWRSL